MPVQFALQRVLPDQLVAQQPVDQVGDEHARPRAGQHRHPFDALVRAEPQHGDLGVRRPAEQAPRQENGGFAAGWKIR